MNAIHMIAEPPPEEHSVRLPDAVPVSEIDCVHWLDDPLFAGVDVDVPHWNSAATAA